MIEKLDLNNVNSFMLEDWVKSFGIIYSEVDFERTATSLWLDVIGESSSVAEFIRREKYNKALDTLSSVFCRLLCFVAKYSINASDTIVAKEGVDLRSGDNNNFYITKWLLRRYPALCSECANNPCICPSLKVDKETGPEESNIGYIIATRLKKYDNWENEISNNISSFNVEKLFKMFNDIYSGIHYSQSISSLCSHFLEKVGEVTKLLLSIDNIQIFRAENNLPDSHENNLRYLNSKLKEEISDIISWIMALINKMNFISYYRFLEKKMPSDRIFKNMTLSELLFNTYFDQEINKFICPSCFSDKCTPNCRKEGLVAEIDSDIKKEADLLHEIKRAVGQEKRKCRREKTNILTKLETSDLLIVNMGEHNMGFLSDYLFSLNDERLIKIRKNDTDQVIKFKITRPTNADRDSTGYKYFYGAEILGAEILYRENITH